MNETTYERYDDDFKKSSAKLALESNQPYAQTARDLGLKVNTLYTWINKLSEVNKGANSPLQDEVKQLRAEVSKLKTERDILKKAAAYFAKHTR